MTTDMFEYVPPSGHGGRSKQLGANGGHMAKMVIIVDGNLVGLSWWLGWGDGASGLVMFKRTGVQ